MYMKDKEYQRNKTSERFITRRMAKIRQEAGIQMCEKSSSTDERSQTKVGRILERIMFQQKQIRLHIIGETENFSTAARARETIAKPKNYTLKKLRIIHKLRTMYK